MVSDRDLGFLVQAVGGHVFRGAQGVGLWSSAFSLQGL